MDKECAPSLASIVTPEHTAVLVVDVEPFFTNGTKFSPLDGMLPRPQRFLGAAKEAGVRRVFIRGVIPEECWTARCREFPLALRIANLPGSPLNDDHPDFRPEADDLALIKDRYSAFIGTELELLRERDIRSVIVAGLVTDICAGSTALDAFQRDFYTVTLAECGAASSLDAHEISLKILAKYFGRVCTFEGVLGAWQAQPALAAALA